MAEPEHAVSEKIALDPHRPQYHFLPPANWMNDPNGLIQWGDEYHLFYQYNPHGAFHGGFDSVLHWGHAVSKDLVHWRDLPVALAPTPDGPDKDGCWSGCAVDHDGVPTLAYTGVRPEVQCIATSSDGLITWEKHPRNPVIAAPPEGLDVTGFRDPYVWREGDTWYAMIGSGIKGVGGTILLYRSRDLVEWEYIHPACIGDPNETGTMWECPNFFPLGDKHVLLLSPIPLRKSIYLIGAYQDHTFVPEAQGVLDNGGHFYAPQVMQDRQGRWLMWGWLWEGRDNEAQRTAGWAGVMSVPRVLSLRADGRLGMEPPPDLQSLRRAHHHKTDVHVDADSPEVLEAIQGNNLEIMAEFEPVDAQESGLKVLRSPDGEEETLIMYDPLNMRLSVDRQRASTLASSHRDVQHDVLELAPGETLQLHIFVDRSVVEVFANGRCCLTTRVYPARADSVGLALFARGGSVKLRSLDVWEMDSIWPAENRAEKL